MPGTVAAHSDIRRRNYESADYIERLDEFDARARVGAAVLELERCQRLIVDLERAQTEAVAQDAVPRAGWLSFTADVGMSPDELTYRGWLSCTDPAPGELPFGSGRECLAVELALARSKLAAAQQHREAASRELRALHDFRARARARRIPADHARPYRSRASRCRTPRRRRTSAVVRATGDPDPEPDSGDARARLRNVVGLIEAACVGGAL